MALECGALLYGGCCFISFEDYCPGFDGNLDCAD